MLTPRMSIASTIHPPALTTAKDATHGANE
jgi:hypothetical protein